MNYRIELREVAPQLLAVVRDVATSETLTAKILGSPVWDYIRANGIRSSGHNIVVYFPTGTEEFGVEIGADVLAPFKGSDTVFCSATPAGMAATTRHVGPYSRLSEAHAALNAWCKEHRHQRTGVSWEVYGHWNDDPAKLETDIFLQVDQPAN
jgi:effector-binding domain-containing protein